MTSANDKLVKSGYQAGGAAGASEFDAYSRSYDAEVNKAIAFSGLSIDFFTAAKAEHLLDVLAAHFGKTAGLNLLDVGCGVGNYHGLLGGAVGGIAGIDVSQDCIAVARSRHPNVDYRSFDGTDIPHAAASFDAAYAVCVYHHVRVAERARLTQSVMQILKPGGLFAIYEHNPLNPLTMRVVNKCEFDRDAVLLRSAESEALLSAAGFGDIATRFILTVPAKGAALRSIDRAFSRLPLGTQYCTVGVKPAVEGLV